MTAVLDAGRGEGYVGEYEVSVGTALRKREFIVKLAEFSGGGELLTPDKGVADSLQAGGARVRW